MTASHGFSTWFILLAVLDVVAVNWAFVAFLIRLAPKIGLVDRPNERSLHTKVTPRGGGVVMVAVLALVTGGWLVWEQAAEGLRLPLLTYLGAALFIAGVSLRDDFKSLSPALRFGCQLLVAALAVFWIGSFAVVELPGVGPIQLGWAGFGLTILWIVGLTNVYNFMDGIDGIAGVQGVIAGLAWAVAGFWFGAPVVAMLGLLLAGGCLGFLIHNWSPARIFMGDVGSAFLGYSFAVLPLLFLRSGPASGGNLQPGVIPVFALLVVWPFVSDGLYTFIRRTRRGEPVWKPHRSHLYQRLVQSGWSHARVSSLYAGWGMLSAAAGLCCLLGPGFLASALAVLSLGALAAVYALVSARERAKAAQ